MTLDTDAYGDSYFLAQRDKTINDFRESDKNTKRKIIEKMLTLRHNMKYNKHLLSVYLKAKSLFDTMIEEHRAQLHSLDEIYRHLNHIIRENLTTQKNKNIKNAGITTPMMAELVKDKKRIGALLKKMRVSFNKLMDIDTVIGVTIAQINEITFMEDHDESEGEDDESESEGEDDESEGEAEAEADEESEGEEDDDESEGEEADEDDEESEGEAEADEESEGEESEGEAEADDDHAQNSIIYSF